MSSSKNTADLISSMAREAVRGKSSGKEGRKGDLKTIAKDLLAAVKSGSEDDVAAVLEALGEVSKAGDED